MHALTFVSVEFFPRYSTYEAKKSTNDLFRSFNAVTECDLQLFVSLHLIRMKLSLEIFAHNFARKIFELRIADKCRQPL